MRNSRYKIKWNWVNNKNTKCKDEQTIKIESTTVRILDIMYDIDKTVSFITKKNDKLKGREGEVKNILENFVIDVYSSTDLE